MKKLIAVFIACMVVLSTLVVPSFATDYQSPYRFGNWAYTFLKDVQGWTPNARGWGQGVCAISPDTMHHCSTYTDIDEDGLLLHPDCVFVATCDYCGNEFHGTATEVEEIYDELTPDYSINDEGVITGFGRLVMIKEYYTNVVSYSCQKINDEYGEVYTVTSDNSFAPSFGIAYEFTIAVDCVVHFGGQFNVVYWDDPDVTKGIYSSLSYLGDDGEWHNLTPTRPDYNKFEYYFNAVAGRTYRINSITSINSAKSTENMYGSRTVHVNLPYLYYNIDSVMIDDAPIVGGGAIEYIDESGNRQYIENQFFDQSTNTYHNPVTDTSSTVESWEYDYSTRTYTGHTENGDVLITYGDENITVQEGNNIYNYYYASPDGSGGSGSSGGGSDNDNETIWDKLGNLLGNLFGGLIDLISGVISGLLDSLIELVGVTLDKLGSIVNLFGSFGDALKSLWSWLPEDIVTILAAGVSVVVFASVIKLFI